MTRPKIIADGDCGIAVVFGDKISDTLNRQVHRFTDDLRGKRLVGILDIIPSYCSVLIHYDPLQIDHTSLVSIIETYVGSSDNQMDEGYDVVYLPVLYGGAYGMDIGTVAAVNNLTLEDVIRLHTVPYYRIYMIGFKAGFPYLGGLLEALETPRLKTPRIKVKAGSVGIAGKQTGIYPQDSPGGWQLIGQMPIPLIDWNHPDVALLKPGQYVKFYSVDEETYQALLQQVSQGIYPLKVVRVKEVPK
ncbi:MAG: 5-oxoprolinase subunit PxpB [Clostridia bacterium]|nr:5-oxoprolinase subunit PxpB [Clostridia bacterium]